MAQTNINIRIDEELKKQTEVLTEQVVQPKIIKKDLT